MTSLTAALLECLESYWRRFVRGQLDVIQLIWKPVVRACASQEVPRSCLLLRAKPVTSRPASRVHVRQDGSGKHGLVGMTHDDCAHGRVCSSESARGVAEEVRFVEVETAGQRQRVAVALQVEQRVITLPDPVEAVELR